MLNIAVDLLADLSQLLQNAEQITLLAGIIFSLAIVFLILVIFIMVSLFQFRRYVRDWKEETDLQ